MIHDWVIDTNVFVSAAITPGGICHNLLLHAARGTLRITWNNIILKEYRDVLSRPKFALDSASIRNLLSCLPTKGQMNEVLSLNLDLQDPTDLPFLSLSYATTSKTIVTGNLRHFPKEITGKLGIRLLLPAQALDLLMANSMAEETSAD